MQLPTMLRTRLALLGLTLLGGCAVVSTVATGADLAPRIRISFAHGLKTQNAPNDARVRIHGVIRENGREARGVRISIAEKATGGPTVTVGSAKSDRHGGFGFTLPPGGSRTVAAVFNGVFSNALVINQSTRIYLKASPRHVRSGGRVTFRGHVRELVGQVVLVELQVRKGRAYQTFLVAHTKPDGSFQGRFRFGRGTARYGFRAIIERQAAFPFARSKSKALSVRVG